MMELSSLKYKKYNKPQAKYNIIAKNAATRQKMYSYKKKKIF